jgi:hypothetical protein
MGIVYFPCLPEGDVVQVEFASPDGSAVSMPLLVDSGFTGRSSFVLPPHAGGLAWSLAPDSEAGGALHGRQTRVTVVCRIPQLSFRRFLTAILADVSSLCLPPGTRGVAGLQFLRQFERWGAEHVTDGTWRFFLSDDALTS